MKHAAERGFMLIEVLVAIFVLGVVTVVVMGMVTLGVRASLVSEQRTVAQGIVTEELERVRLLPYDQVGYVDGSPVGVLLASRAISRNGQQYDVVYVIDLVDDPNTSGADDFKRVTVTVTAGLAGRLPPVTATTLVVPGGGVVSCHGFYWRFDEGNGSTFNDNAGCSAGLIAGSQIEQAWDTTPDNPRLQFANPAALRFSGSGTPYHAYVSQFNFSGAGEGSTLSFWVAPFSRGPQSGNHFIFGSADTNNRIRILPSQYVRISTYGYELQGYYAPGFIYDGENWYHIAIVRSGNEADIYIEGENAGGGPLIGDLLIDRIGEAGFGGGVAQFDGGLDDMRVYDRALTAQEIQQLSDGQDVD